MDREPGIGHHARNRAEPGEGMTSGGQAAVARGTAAVFVDGRRNRVGGAGRPPAPGHRRARAAAPGPAHFGPGRGGAGRARIPRPGARRAAWQDGGRARVDLGPAGDHGVAVLDLGEDRPGWLPPVPVSPRRPRVMVSQVFGYPLATSQGGVAAVHDRLGHRRDGAAGLDRRRRHLPRSQWRAGHRRRRARSGGLVEKVRPGPVPAACRHADRPGVAASRPSLMAGAEPGEARSHFTRRACGQRAPPAAGTCSAAAPSPSTASGSGWPSWRCRRWC